MKIHTYKSTYAMTNMFAHSRMTVCYIIIGNNSRQSVGWLEVHAIDMHLAKL